jgi:nucleotide-binding universal stress UspA family protein
MRQKLLHIYRNTPLGRETILQSACFAEQLGLDLHVYIPEHRRFLMYFEHEAVQIDLDGSYLTMPGSARHNATQLCGRAEGEGLHFVEPSAFTASGLPDLPTNYEFMCCPRVVSEGTAKLSLGHIGTKVRKIMVQAPFPVLIPSPVYKPWTSVAALFGGSDNAVASLRLALRVARDAGVPLRLFSQAEPGDRDELEGVLEEHGLLDEVLDNAEWTVFEEGELTENLFAVPHDALVCLGAYGHGFIRDVVFGSTMELVQTNLPNNLLIVGPRCWARRA